MLLTIKHWTVYANKPKAKWLHIQLNSTKVQNPRHVNELYIHWNVNPASHLMENCEELAQPQRKLEKHAVLYFREPLKAFEQQSVHSQLHFPSLSHVALFRMLTDVTWKRRTGQATEKDWEARYNISGPQTHTLNARSPLRMLTDVTKWPILGTV